MSSQDHILVVDDDAEIRSLLSEYLQKNGYRVTAVADGKGMWAALDSGPRPDIVVLDLMLPGDDGLTLCRNLRARSELPVIMLTARGEETDRIVGLEMGADDYLAKPFAFEELLARVRALIRRKDSDKSVLLKACDLILDTQKHVAVRNGSEIQLTPKEYSILEYLLKNKNKVISRTILTEHVYDFHFDPDTNVIDVYINKLRNKIDKGFEKPLLNTVRGVGYLIRED